MADCPLDGDQGSETSTSGFCRRHRCAPARGAVHARTGQGGVGASAGRLKGAFPLGSLRRCGPHRCKQTSKVARAVDDRDEAHIAKSALSQASGRAQPERSRKAASRQRQHLVDGRCLLPTRNRPYRQPCASSHQVWMRTGAVGSAQRLSVVSWRSSASARCNPTIERQDQSLRLTNSSC